MTSPSRIHALPLQLANQIAAGEVIERPASVIKELVENSLDAGADEIYVAVEGSGSQLILVRDNGSGIHSEDLQLAISRHATSKLYSTAELNQIASLGFRGEALPSIQSVSNFRLASRQQESDCGWQISGDNQSIAPVPQPIGTQVEVRDLFFNIPARRRFLRSARTEQQHILTTLQRLALSRFDVSWRLEVNGQTKLQLPIAQTPAEKHKRLTKICGQRFSKHAVWLSHDLDEMQLTGWISPPEAHRPQTDVQYFFINGRVIRDRLIQHAIRQAYGHLIPAGRQPAFVLYLTLPLDRVDVNVHPTKHEVRFREARLIHGMISHAIMQKLQSDQAKTAASIDSATSQHHVAEPSLGYAPHPTQSSPHKIVASLSPQTAQPALTLLCILAGHYALIQQQHSLWLIDLAAAHKTTVVQTFKTAADTQTLAIRPILVPLVFAADTAQKRLIAEHKSLLSQLGLAFAENDSGIVLKQLPTLLLEVDKSMLVTCILRQLNAAEISFHSLLKTLQALLPLHQTFNTEQATQLLKKLPPDSWPQHVWARLLDKNTLSGLFSGQ